MKNKMFGIFVVVAIIALVIWVATRRREKGGTMLSWQFFRQQDSEGNDIKFMPGLAGNIDGLKDACKSTEGCVAFNTAGYLKSAVNPNGFKDYSGYPDWSGIYVKRSALK